MWQVIYDELKSDDFMMISVALDTAGTAAVRDRIRPSDLAGRPDAMRRLRGWSKAEWSAQAPPAYPCLIDEEHVVAALYGMTNVPMAVWIDERGRIVRPAEPAGVSDHFRRIDRETLAIPDDDAAHLEANRRRYVDALRDWVRNGESSQYALTPEQVRSRTRPRGDADVRAALHVRIARRLYRDGGVEAAKRHLDRAVELCPEKWNYRRQALVLDPERVGALNVSPEYLAAMAALGQGAFYPQIDMPGQSAPPDWLEARDVPAGRRPGVARRPTER